ncbi:MAG: LamG domain-containing protein [Clostridiales bacterium]|nr:LamG domain-containing protein [Clostridiales bacterium]
MKKLFALILCAAMMLSLVSFASADEAELPEAFAHITFDGEDEGYKAITNGEKDEADPLLDGANKSIVPADQAFVYGEGPVGKALFLDGTYGLDLGLKPTNTDTWTVSFWVNASRLSDYGPTLQIGYNMSRDEKNANVTWMNVTQTNWDPKYFPTIWSRNVASNAPDGTACWPWMAPFQDGGAMIGKREWAMFTIVCSGEEQTGGNGQKTVGAQLYVNGALAYDSADNYENGTYFTYTWDATLAPNIMKPGDDTFEAYFGVNYWDTIFKGYVDDLYVFDSALNADQVAKLYAMGNPAIDSPKDGPGAEEAPAEEAAAPVAVTITGTAVGAEDCTTPFWGAHSDIWAVPAGEFAGVVIKNYNAGEEAANWNNFNVVLQNTPTGHSAADAEGYMEYAVVRSDNYGWGAGYDNNPDLVLEPGWEGALGPQLNGATILIIVHNDGEGNISVGCFGDKVDGSSYSQSYQNIKADGDVYFCLVVDNCCLDITEVLSNEDVISLLGK